MDLLDELAAERDIRRIIALYAQYADDRDAAAYAGLFTEDGILNLRAGPTHGRAAIEAGMGSHDLPPLQHAMFNVLLQIESATSATGSVDALISVKGENGWAPMAVLRYADRYEKTAEGWRIAERVSHSR